MFQIVEVLTLLIHHFPVQITAQVMVSVMMKVIMKMIMQAVCVTPDGQVLIVQLLFAQRTAQVMVYVIVMEAETVILTGQALIVQFSKVELPPQSRSNNVRDVAGRGETSVRHMEVSMSSAGKILFDRVYCRLRITACSIVEAIAIVVSDGNVFASNALTLLQTFITNTYGSSATSGSHGTCQCTNGL